MPLPTPILDDRSYRELRDELVRRIPVYNPEWTNHNASDPGITLIELFAFLGENLLFRFNQIPDATRLAFLRLLDVDLRPPSVARGMVALSTKTPSGDLVPLGSEARAGEVPFETLNEVDVLPVTDVVMIKEVARQPSTYEETRSAQHAIDRLGGVRAGTERVAYFRGARLLSPGEPGAAPLNAPLAVDGMIWIAVLRTRYTDPRALGGKILNLGFVPEQEVASMADVKPCRGGAAREEEEQACIWEAMTSTLVGERRMPEYRRLPVVGDTTLGLTRTGVVRLELPADLSTLRPPPADPDIAGAGDLPPALEDEDEAASVLLWIRVSRRRNDLPFARVRWMGVNASEVRQSRRVGVEFVGVGTGQPDQQYLLVHRPVLEESLVLEVEQGGSWTQWTEVPGFGASRPDDLHFTLDREAGVVRFGNGISGRPPQIGERIRAREYRFGGGPEGNVPARAISRMLTPAGVKPENPLPTSGGSRGEQLAEALDRVPGEIRRRDRAVTADDFRELALLTPGAHLGRAEVLPRFDPRGPQENVPGVVSVVVWPSEDPRNPNAPMPARDVLRLVCEWLDERRLITTELWVIPPTYRKIAVAVGLAVKPGYGVEAVRRWVELVVRQYLAPLPPYGPEGGGWPMGRRVLGPEISAAALQVEGVAYLEAEPKLAEWDPEARRWTPRERLVELRPWEVPELWEITVVEGAPLEPGQAVGPESPAPIPELPRVEESRLPPAPGSSLTRVPPPGTPNRPSPVVVPLPLPRTEC